MKTKSYSLGIFSKVAYDIIEWVVNDLAPSLELGNGIVSCYASRDQDGEIGVKIRYHESRTFGFSGSNTYFKRKLASKMKSYIEFLAERKLWTDKSLRSMPISEICNINPTGFYFVNITLEEVICLYDILKGNKRASRHLCYDRILGRRLNPMEMEAWAEKQKLENELRRKYIMKNDMLYAEYTKRMDALLMEQMELKKQCTNG